MNKVFTSILMVFALMLTIPVASAFAEGMPEGEMDVPQLAPFKYAPAAFDHDAHNEKAGLEDDCSACHHGSEDGKKVLEYDEELPCADCHTVKKQKGVTPLRRAFHLQCITVTNNRTKALCSVKPAISLKNSM